MASHCPDLRDTSFRIVSIIGRKVQRYLRLVTSKEMTMSLNLPKTIADYIEANERLDLQGMLKHFQPDAVFIDNGKRYEGVAEIRNLLEEEAIAVKAIFTPDTVREEDGDVVVEGPAHGDFPGSPLRFTYRFTLAHGAIKTLETTV
jgi:hypothetical protein